MKDWVVRKKKWHSKCNRLFLRSLLLSPSLSLSLTHTHSWAPWVSRAKAISSISTQTVSKACHCHKFPKPRYVSWSRRLAWRCNPQMNTLIPTLFLGSRPLVLLREKSRRSWCNSWNPSTVSRIVPSCSLLMTRTLMRYLSLSLACSTCCSGLRCVAVVFRCVAGSHDVDIDEVVLAL